MLIETAKEHPESYTQAYELFCSHREKPWSYSLFVSTLDKANALFAFDNSKVVGYIIYTCIAGEGELEDICVHSQYRQKGIAQALITAIIDSAKSLKMDYLLLEVNESNESAIALYTKNAFSKIGTRKHYYAHNDGTFSDAFVMQKMI